MSRTAYPAVIEQGQSDFGVYFPDLPGCVSAGSSIAEAIQNAHEGLALHVAGMVEDGETLPKPSTIEAITVVPADIIVAAILMIGVTLPGPSQHIEVAIDEAVLQEIDRLGQDRSQFLTDAARAELARRMAS